ncbi:MAG: hypothetical protein KIT84_01885 [Labilithrix sp.]|nr:hypothetical protein [Labilithrix sp.]MCW5809738.1 hypothetical protein [Labilithrix sp.]
MACTEASPPDTSSTEDPVVTDILSMDRNDDGTYRVRCLDSATGQPYVEERVTGDEIRNDAVCKRSPSAATPAARGTFTCAGNAEVIAQFLGADGTEKSFRIATGNWDTCRSVAAKLAETRALISGTSLIAVCGGNAEVIRYSVTPNGDVRALQKIATGNWDTCRAMQNEINQASAIGAGVRGSFLCGGNAELIAHFLIPDGTEKSFKIATGNWDTCRSVAAKLGETRAVISGTSLIAVCGGNAEVIRYSVTPNGDVRELQKIATGNWDTCRAKQTEINQSSASGTGVRGSFACTGNAEVLAQFLAPDGTEKSLSIATGNWDTCRSVATKLGETRALISSTSLIAVCGGNAEVRRFSITPAGEVRELEKIATGNWDTCRAKQAEINR